MSRKLLPGVPSSQPVADFCCMSCSKHLKDVGWLIPVLGPSLRKYLCDECLEVFNMALDEAKKGDCPFVLQGCRDVVQG